MKVILYQDIQDVGKAGEIIEVSEGYFRNYLFPRGLAAVADERRRAELEHRKKEIERKMARLRRDAMSLKERIESLSITITRQAGEEDKLYGSVTSRDIAQALTAQGVDIDHRMVLLEKPIKALGSFEVPIKLHGDIKAMAKVWVVKEE